MGTEQASQNLAPVQSVHYATAFFPTAHNGRFVFTTDVSAENWLL